MVIYVMICNPYFIMLIQYKFASSLSLHFIENTKNAEITEAKSDENW